VDLDRSDPADSAPAFFLSYARPKAPPRKTTTATNYNRPEQKLFDDLTENLAQLLPLPAGQEPGYMDAHLEVGGRWKSELVQMVGTCQIFIALINDSYISTSQWCAMEWDLFSQRRVVPKAGGRRAMNHGTAILPILWAPVVGDMPKVVADVQMFTPAGVPERYERVYAENGVLGMIQMNDEAYGPTIWKLAMQIQTMWASYAVEPARDADIGALRTSFGGAE
jgi:hypothetical protein